MKTLVIESLIFLFLAPLGVQANQSANVLCSQRFPENYTQQVISNSPLVLGAMASVKTAIIAAYRALNITLSVDAIELHPQFLNDINVGSDPRIAFSLQGHVNAGASSINVETTSIWARRFKTNYNGNVGYFDNTYDSIGRIVTETLVCVAGPPEQSESSMQLGIKNSDTDGPVGKTQVEVKSGREFQARFTLK